MDEAALSAYDRDANCFASDWETQPPPTDLHAVVQKFFIQGGSTADVGCGSGRDANWLSANGYPATGFDASEGLLSEARVRHPQLQFATAALPGLEGIAEGSFTIVLCETVIMHLEPETITPAVERLLSVLAPGGILYLCWRVTKGADKRDEHGRLYAAFDPERVLRALTGTEVLLDEQVGSVSSGKLIGRIVARKQNIENQGTLQAESKS
jgi:SAM-dependent methyltransferase